jgi:membrane-associated phospholipid phosphatase
LRQIATDFKNVFSRRESLVIGAVGSGAAWGAHHFDDRIVNSGLNSELHGGGTLDHVFEAGQILGGAPVQIGGAFATYGLARLFSHRQAEDLGRDLVRAQVVTQSLTTAIKFAVGRERPDGSSRLSFPSGHASGAFATATVLERRYGWKTGVPAYAVAGYIATSRLNEGRHHLSDIVFGAALGIMAGRAVTFKAAKGRLEAGPTTGPAGVGVQLTYSWF